MASRRLHAALSSHGDPGQEARALIGDCPLALNRLGFHSFSAGHAQFLPHGKSFLRRLAVLGSSSFFNHANINVPLACSARGRLIRVGNSLDTVQHLRSCKVLRQVTFGQLFNLETHTQQPYHHAVFYELPCISMRPFGVHLHVLLSGCNVAVGPVQHTLYSHMFPHLMAFYRRKRQPSRCSQLDTSKRLCSAWCLNSYLP